MATDLELEISGTGPGDYEVRVVHAAAGGEPTAGLQLDVDELLARRPELEATVLASSVSARRVVPLSEEPVQQVGEQLFRALFTGPVYGTYRASLGAAQERQERLRIVLRLDAPELALLPWEMLFDPEDGAYLCRHEPLVRHVPALYTREPQRVSPPLRVLVIIASPRGLPPLDTDAERRRLERALAGQVAAGRVELTWLPAADWDSVQAALLEGEWHVLHFIGHGDYDADADEGLIALVDDDGGPHMVAANQLVDLLGMAEPTPRLVVLNSCASAQGGTHDVFSSTGAALVRSGISAVAAMQFTVSDRAAVHFAQGFYTSLASGHRIDEAARSGRIAMLGCGRTALEWITPVLYVRGETTELFTFTSAPPPAPPAREPGPPPGAQPQPGRSQPPDASRHEAQLRALRVMAGAELRIGNHDKAIELLDDLLTLAPDDHEAAALRETAARRCRLAGLHERAAEAETAQDWTTAIEAYAEILQEQPEDRDAAARRERCRARQHVADLQAELRYHAEAGRWRAVLDVDEELRRLDASAADPAGLATRARGALQDAEREDGLRTALDERAAAHAWEEVRDLIAELAALRPEAAGDYAALADRARRELRAHPPETGRIDFGHEVYALAWDPGGGALAVSGAAASARVYDVNDATGRERLEVAVGVPELHWVYAVAFSPDGTRLATGSDNHTGRIWDAATGRRTLEVRHDKAVLAVAFSPDGTRVATGGLDRTGRVWDAATGETIAEVLHDNTVFDVAFSPDGRRVATGGLDQTARVWDAATGEKILEVRHDDAVFAVAFSPDGRRIATGSHDRTARIWDATTGERTLEVRHDDTVYAVAFSPDGRRIATGSHDRTARIWDATTGERTLEVRHDDTVYAVAFSPDGRRIATGSHDRTARIWDATTGENITEVGHENNVLAVAFSPDGDRLATGSHDHTVRIWPVGDA
ncbi:CHAT domain-containing protein [Streptomyces sichuanensis]|uniref:CHAT domain-containing protein n=1 Tax=Streptomyces sichuanensis TaxID=2871810 RepID=UPI0021F08B89|nr:CHAT domain-containing protein [Streptomyces sichuanensis]